eukprot:1062902-Heterocapsa_arctica.AAC.1
MRFNGRADVGLLTETASYKPITTAVEGDMCSSAVAMRRKLVNDARAEAEQVAPRYSPTSPSKGRSCYVMSSDR